MPRIAEVATATPPHPLGQEQIKEFASRVFGTDSSVDRLLTVFDNANIQNRNFAVGLDWFQTPHNFTEVNDRYIEASLELTETVVCDLATKCGIGTEEFDAIFFISTTGLSTPSIDARLFNRIPLNPHIKRIPIWGLGCAGGAGGIARAFDYVKAYPKHRALVVAVELCGLAFQINDRSKSNIVATALFGDGAGACLVVGDDVPVRPAAWAQPSIVSSLSTIYPDSLDVMGWRITSEGFKVVLSKDIPSIVTSLVKDNINELLTSANVPLTAIEHFVAHPGGTKVLQAYCEGLSIGLEDLAHSVDVLREHGNMSSATIFFILERFLASHPESTGAYGLLTALGPGFSSELVLVRWD